MKLYYARFTRAGRVRWLLEEAGAPYELERLDMRAGDHKATSYLAIHPHGVVPALEIDGFVLYESVAICLHLADLLPDAHLAPAVGTPDRALYYQWMVYANATLEPPIHQYASHTRFLPEDRRVAAVAEDAQGKVRHALTNLERVLSGRETLLEAFSAADIIIGGMLMWAKSMGLVAGFPVLLRYCDRLAQRPAYKRSNAD